MAYSQSIYPAQLPKISSALVCAIIANTPKLCEAMAATGWKPKQKGFSLEQTNILNSFFTDNPIYRNIFYVERFCPQRWKKDLKLLQ